MSENIDSEQGSGSGSPTGGGLSDESNGYVHVGSDNEGADSAQMGGIPLNQEEAASQLVDNVDEDNGVVVTGGDAVDDVKVADDGGKEEFVDCSEELNTFSDNREALEAFEAEKNLGDDEVVARSSASDHGSGHREATPDTTTGEGEISVQEYEEERRSVKNELANLQHQLDTKNQEIADLNASINEEFLAHEMTSKAQLEKDQDIEASANRMLSSLATVFGEEVFYDESLRDKMFRVERSTSYLSEMYRYFLSEVELLSHCLTEVNSDLHLQTETDKIFLTAREELVKQKHKEAELAHEISRLEEENRKLVDQVDKDREMIEMSNAEIGKLKGELEQEKTRYGNTKEKLSMAVTKGKALVQQRDSLKQMLADKTSELEKCLSELQEKSTALEAAELRNEDLIRSQTLADSLQEALSLKDSILGKCEEVLSLNCAKEELQSLDMVGRIVWLANERNALAVEAEKLTEALSASDLPDNVQSSSLESRISWLFESYYQAKDEATNLADEFAKIKEIARNEIDHLTASLLVETQEKNYLSEELEELKQNYEGVVEKEREVSMEKKKMVEMLLVASGIGVEEQDDVALVFEKCIGKIKEQTADSLQSSSLEPEIFEKIQTLLYIRDQECMLSEKILEEEDLDKSEMKNRLKELVMVSEELKALKVEKDSLQADLQKSEEKSTLLREKLSMAVKKGKGLVQDRENTKQLLGEKNALIEKLNLELKDQESAISDFKNQIDRLSTDVERIPKLESDLSVMQEQRDQLEQFLMESNTMLQRVTGSIDVITVPIDFEEPVQKVKWLAEYLTECEDAKTHVEEEIKVLKDENVNLLRKLAEAQTDMKSLEEKLSVVERNFSQLAEEKRELEIAKTDIEKELEKAITETASHASRFSEASASKISLEHALALAQNEKGAAEEELQKVREEVSVHISKLDGAHKTIQSLEDEISQLQTNISLLTEENNSAQVDRKELEDEIKKLKEETDTQASKFVDLSSTIKLLEDRISDLVGEKKIAEQEIASLNSQLSAYTQELTGKQGDRSLELSAYLESLQSLFKDETLSTLMRQSFEKKIDSLKDMDQLLNDMKDTVVEMDSELLQKYPTSEDKFTELNLPAGIDDVVNIVMVDDEVSGGNDEVIIGKTVENFRLKRKIFADKFGSSSTIIDELLASLLAKLKATRDSLPDVVEKMKSLQKNVNSLETDRQSQENDNKILLSACMNATQELNFEKESSTLEQEGWDHSLSMNVAEVGGPNEYVKVADELLSTARSVQSLIKDLQDNKNSTSITIGDIQRQLEEMRLTCQSVEEEKEAGQNACSEMRFKLEEREAEFTSLQSQLEKARLNFEKAEEERDISQNKLEDDLEASQNLCTELRLKLEEREAEITSLQSQLQKTRLNFEKGEEERDVSQSRISKLENDLEASQNLCSEIRLKLDEREAELTSLLSQLETTRSTFEKSKEEKDASQNRVFKLVNDFEASQNLCNEMRLKLEEREAEFTYLQSQLEMTRSYFEKAKEEIDVSQNRVSKLENDLEASQNLCNEMRLELEDREAELTSLQTASLMKERETEDFLLSSSQINSLFSKLNEIEVPLSKLGVGDQEPQDSVRLKKLFYIIDNVKELQNQLFLLSHDKEELQSTLSKQTREVEYLKEEVEEHIRDKEDSKLMKSELFELSAGLEGIIQKLGGKELAEIQVGSLLPVLERLVMGVILECQNSKSKAQELEAELLGTRQVVGELTSKVKSLEDSNQNKTASPGVIQEKGLFEAPSSSARSEISEVEEVGPIGKAAIPPLPTAAHARTLRKGSSEQLAIDIDLESNRLIDNEKSDEDKGHVFKSLNTSGIVPVQGKMIADRLDGIWVSGGRALMSRPRARLGLIAYWLVLHLWLLGTIL